VAEAKVAHRPGKHSLLHDAGSKQVHHRETNKSLNGKVYNLTANTQQQRSSRDKQKLEWQGV